MHVKGVKDVKDVKDESGADVMKKMVSGFISKTQAYKDRESKPRDGETGQIGVDTTAVCSFASTFRWKSRMLRALKWKCKVQRVKRDSNTSVSTIRKLSFDSEIHLIHSMCWIRFERFFVRCRKEGFSLKMTLRFLLPFLPSLFQLLAVSVTTLDQDNITKNPIIERSKRRQHEALCLVSSHGPSSLMRMQKVEGERGGSTFAPEISGPQLWRQT